MGNEHYTVAAASGQLKTLRHASRPFFLFGETLIKLVQFSLLPFVNNVPGDESASARHNCEGYQDDGCPVKDRLPQFYRQAKCPQHFLSEDLIQMMA
jgi:hypothetical protein